MVRNKWMNARVGTAAGRHLARPARRCVVIAAAETYYKFLTGQPTGERTKPTLVEAPPKTRRHARSAEVPARAPEISCQTPTLVAWCE